MNIKQKIASGIAATAVMFSVFAAPTFAAPSFSVNPWVYDPGNACPGIISQWDNTTGNPQPSLHLTKPCLTATNAASGATLGGVSGITLTELNFDYRNDGHCGAGAPRFNVDASDGFHFMGGCANGTQTLTSDPNWTHVVIDPNNPAQTFPVLTAGATINSIDIVFDEGNDALGQGTPGSVYIDNISVNNDVVGSPTGPQSSNDCKNGGWKNSNFSPPFKNQGDCVSFVATGGKNQPSGPPKH